MKSSSVRKLIARRDCAYNCYYIRYFWAWQGGQHGLGKHSWGFCADNTA